MIWPCLGSEETVDKNKDFDHKIAAFGKYVWDVHHYSLSAQVKGINGQNVVDASHMRLINNEYYSFPKVQPEEMTRFFGKNGIYKETYQSIIY